MAVSTMWIRNNMLFPPCDQHERQLTEAELKVQRSLQKLSIPDWYLNKRSSPPKILNNVTPIECRPSSWKSFQSAKDSTLNSTFSNLSDTFSHAEPGNTAEKNCNKEIYKVSKQKSPEAKHKMPPSKSSSPKEEVFDTTIPEVKLSTNISRTFPKMSPSRKIQNINLVFASGPPIRIPSDSKNSTVVKTSKCKDVAPKNPPIDANRKNDNDVAKKDETPQKSSTQAKKDNDFRFSEIVDTPVRTPNVKGSFKVRAASTPKFTPANLFSSTIIEESPKVKKVPSRSILEKSSIFEEKSSSCSKKLPENAPRRRLSQSLLEKASFFEDSSKSRGLSSCLETSSKSNSGLSSFLEKNIRTIDPIFFEKDDTALGIPKSSSLVREIMSKLEITGNGVCTPQKKSTEEWKRSTTSVQEKKSNLEVKSPDPIVQAKSPVPKIQVKSNFALVHQDRKVDLETQSPCTRFLNSRRKSADLEHVVRNKLPVRENTVVRGIIEALTEKVSKSSLSRQNEVVGTSQNFVKQLVNALEKGGEPCVIEMASRKNSTTEDDTESCSESEAKSSATTTSLKDTDSNSDSDQRSPTLRSDEENLAFDFMDPATSKVPEDDQKSQLEDDSVYWIPVSRCKLPRTSSLLSMMSRVSANGQSPCVSPIRSDSEAENSRMPAWGGTFKKTNNALSRKLFRIDETTVIDSGYSDRSDRSRTSESITDSTWSEDTQNDSTLENRSTRVKRSSRRKSIIGHTFRVSC